MKFQHPFPGKSRKLALSFEYVHDRYLLLPGYLEKLAFWIRFTMLLLTAFLLFALWQAWGSDFMNWGKSILPKPAPAVATISQVQSAQAVGQKYALQKWEQSLLSVPIQSLKMTHTVPKYASGRRNIFVPSVHLPLFDMHALQSKHSVFASGFTPYISQYVRQTILPFSLGNKELPSRLGSEIALLRSLTEFNRIDIREYLSASASRIERVEEYLTHAESLNTSSRHTLANISARKSVEEEKGESFQIVANQKEQNILEALNAFAPQKTEQNLDELITNKQQVVSTTAHEGLLSTLEKRFSSELGRLSQYVNAVEQNKEALVTNVSVVPTRGIDLGLIQ